MAPRREGLPARPGGEVGPRALPKVVKLLRDIDPTLEFKWDVRDAVTMYPKGAAAVLGAAEDKGTRCPGMWFIGATRHSEPCTI